ncbi:MAG: 5'-nucleotidase C-terminal domain-containing protein [Tannerellaceae bacterium]|nr:5'-nucleotidase C-terminal domain-containing protein [Tannerellaceae bacterium]
MNKSKHFFPLRIDKFTASGRLILVAASLMLLAGSCSSGYRINSVEGKYIQVTHTATPDPAAITLVDSYRNQLEGIINEVIGYATTDLVAGKPESSLTNFTSDVMLTLDTRYTGGKPADFSLMNVNGHRAAIRKGDITVGDIYSTYPFENELIVLTLKGEQVQEVFEAYARMGGAGISSTVQLQIKDKKVSKALIHGQPVDPEQVYTVVTIDYLAEGNNGMQPLTKALSVTPVNRTLRDHMLDYVRNTAASGRQISATTDQRITLE